MSLIPYQIDYSVSSAGKKLGMSKKKISFKFGIANGKALADGLTGANCRGSEHEVQLLWSLGSGKRQVFVDGRNVHYSQTGQNGWTSDRSFQFPFSMNSPGSGGVLQCQLVVVPTDTMNRRPFDLHVNGLSYFEMCKIYELGTGRMMSAMTGRNANYGGYTSARDDELAASAEERRQIAQAKLESLRELRVQEQQQQQQGERPRSLQPPPMNRDEGNLIDFGSDEPPVHVSAQEMRHHSSVTLDPALMTTEDAMLRQAYMQQQQQQPPPPPRAQPFGSVNPYSNYTLGTSTASSYGDTTAPLSVPSTVASTVPSTVASSYAPQPQWNTAAAAPPQPQWNTAAAAAPPQPQWNTGGAAPPQPQWNATTAAPPPEPVSYTPVTSSEPPPFASPQSYASYGSAPAFAQPPRAQAPPGYPQQQQQPW